MFLRPKNGANLEASQSPHPIRVGLFSNEPARLELMSRMFEDSWVAGRAALIPIYGRLAKLLEPGLVQFLIIDLKGLPNGLTILRYVHESSPWIRLLIVEAERDDETIVEAVLVGARGCIELEADSLMLRKAIEHVSDGLIWVSHQVSSRVLDRLIPLAAKPPSGFQIN